MTHLTELPRDSGGCELRRRTSSINNNNSSKKKPIGVKNHSAEQHTSLGFPSKSTLSTGRRSKSFPRKRRTGYLLPTDAGDETGVGGPPNTKHMKGEGNEREADNCLAAARLPPASHLAVYISAFSGPRQSAAPFSKVLKRKVLSWKCTSHYKRPIVRSIRP